MEFVRLGRKGQVWLPAGVLRKLGLQGPATLLVEATEDGAILLRPAAVKAIELYSDARVRGFEQANRNTAAENVRVAQVLKRRRR